MAGLEDEQGEDRPPLLSATQHAERTSTMHLERTEDADTNVVLQAVRLWVSPWQPSLTVETQDTGRRTCTVSF